MTVPDSIPRVKRKVSFVQTAAWCATSAKQAFELCSRDTVSLAFKDYHYESPRNFTEVVRPQVHVGYVDDVSLIAGLPIMLSPDGCIPTEGFLSKPHFASLLQPYAAESIKDAVWEGLKTGKGEIELDLPIATTVIDEEAVFIGGNPNFGHFLNECILRVPMFEIFPELRDKRLLIYDFVPQRFVDFILLMGIDPDRILRIPSGQTISCKRLWFGTTPVHLTRTKQFAVWPDAIHRCRARMTANLPAGTWAKRERLFLWRGQGTHRTLRNETEIAELCARRGFRVVKLAEHSARDQVSIVANCAAIAGPLGAGMSISMLAAADSTIIQFLPHNRILLPYNSDVAAMVLGQPIATVVGFPKRDEDQTSANALYDDYVVDPSAVDAMITRALETPV